MAWRHSSICPRLAQPSLLLLSSRQPSPTLTSQNAWPSCVASEAGERRRSKGRIAAQSMAVHNLISWQQAPVADNKHRTVVYSQYAALNYDVMHSC